MPVRITALIDPATGPSARRLAWLASDAGDTPVGSAFLRLPARDGQRHLAELQLHVHPVERRRGTGSALLDAAVTAARADSRRSVIAQADADSPGEAFLRARGFRRALTLTYARLALADTDDAALAAIVDRPHPGYRLTSWDGTVPDGLAATFARSRRAMDDMPMNGVDFGTVEWDVTRVREVAAAVAERGEHLHTVVAVDTADGSVAGFTELVVPTDGTGDAQHYGTGILPEHRGRGLALWMKAAAVRQVRERHPGLTGLLADTADANPSMRRVNDALGYAPTHSAHLFRLDLREPTDR
ncbi:GNAT family N-acetyltransferase [Kitasatospora sp. NPDC048722]|uniref:GNAT family N-acetyltransferase n=1 Tax=Kitasatospora sp. NPDC048722 TaxID=3155639 RepID=UPI0033EC9AFC